MGGFELMIVAVVGIGCATGVACSFFDTVKTAILRRRTQEDQKVLEEVQALREEVRALRQENHTVILSLDTTVDRLDHRVAHLESRAPLAAGRTGAVESEAAVPARRS